MKSRMSRNLMALSLKRSNQMFRSRLKISGVTLGLLVLGGGAASSASGQQTQNNNAAAPPQRRSQMRRTMMRRRAMGGMMRGIRQLDLTDQQKQQLRSIMQTQDKARKRKDKRCAN